MKNLLLLVLLAALTFGYSVAQEPTAKKIDPKQTYAKFEISAGYLFNISNTDFRSDFGYVDFSYRFTKLIGLKAAFGMGNTYNVAKPTAYSGTISVVANPMNEKSNFSLVPSLGVGLSWNYPQINAKNGANLFLDLSILAKYKINELLYCGVELKTLCYGISNAEMFAGVRIGLSF